MTLRQFLGYLLSIVMLITGLAACGSPDSAILTEQSSGTATASARSGATRSAETATASVPTGPTPLAGDGPWTVAFDTTDGTALSGIITGQGAVGVVFAPMYPGGKEGWAAFAQAAAQQGYRSLAFDFRGHGDSQGDRDVLAAPEDLRAAVDLLKANGAQQIVLIGAGPGGMAAIRLAPQDPAIRGIAIISSARTYDKLEITDADLDAINIPSLWLAARNDMTQQVEDMAAQAGGGPKTLWMYEGSSVQGTYLLEGADGPDMQRRLLEFIASAITG
jgi:alpha/beta hydrolase family protein